MKYVEKKNLRIPALGFGTWEIKGKDCKTSVSDAIKIGYRHIDTAQAYENEEYVGQGIKDSGLERTDLWLTTKIWRSHIQDGDMMDSLDESLKKLQTEYVDLVLLHWPVEETDLGEQMKTLKQIQESGKAKHVGVSNYTVELLKRAKEGLEANIVTNQVEYHPFLPQGPVLDFLRDHDMFLTAYSPLARGETLENGTLSDLGDKYDKSPAQVALRWLIQQDDVVAIPKAASKDHAESNFDIFDFELSEEDMQAIFALQHQKKRIVNPDFSPEWDTAKAA